MGLRHLAPRLLLAATSASTRPRPPRRLCRSSASRLRRSCARGHCGIFDIFGRRQNPLGFLLLLRGHLLHGDGLHWRGCHRGWRHNILGRTLLRLLRLLHHLRRLSGLQRLHGGGREQVL
jgi:hypothetical protein